jgi:hypothetical protein
MIAPGRPGEPQRPAFLQRDDPGKPAELEVGERPTGDVRAGLDPYVREQQHVPAHRDGAQHLVLEHRHRERGRGQIGDGPGDDVADRPLHSLGKVVVEETEHEAQVLAAHRPRLHRGLQVHDVAVCRGDERDGAVEPGPAQGPLGGIADHHGQAEVARERDSGRLRVVIDEGHVEAKVVQPADHPDADLAAADDDHVPAARSRLAADLPGQPGADDDRGDERDHRHPVDGEQHLRHLLGDAIGWSRESGPGHVHDPQVDHVPHTVTGHREQDEPRHGEGEQDAEDRSEPVHDEPPGDGERGAHRVPLPGQRVARCAVGHREHQVGAAVQVLGGDQLGGARGVVGDRQPAEHLAHRHVRAPGHVQGAAGHPHMTRRDLAEGGGDKRRRGELAARQHGAVAEESGDVIAEPAVERGDD